MTNALSCSTSPAAVRPNPLTTAPVPFRKKARSSRAAFQMRNDRRAFRLRFRDGRCAPAPFPPSLRLRFTFPFAEPQAEAPGSVGKTHANAAQPDGRDSQMDFSKFALLHNCCFAMMFGVILSEINHSSKFMFNHL